MILCIGETLEERAALSPLVRNPRKASFYQGEGGKTDEVNKRQLGAVIPKVKDPWAAADF